MRSSLARKSLLRNCVSSSVTQFSSYKLLSEGPVWNHQLYRHRHSVAAHKIEPIEQISPKPLNLKAFSEIPGPKGFPLIGTLWEYFNKDGFSKMFQLMQTKSKKFGPIYKEKYGLMHSVVISDPDEYLKVINVDGKTPRRLKLLPMAHYLDKRGLGLGLVNGQGEEWYRLRTILIKKILPPREIFNHADSMNEVANDFMKYMHRIRASSGLIPNLNREIFKWSLETIGSVLFDDRIGCFMDPPPQLTEEFIENLIGFFRYMQPLMYNVPIYQIYPTKMWKAFEKCTDNVMAVATSYVNKKVELLQNKLEHDDDKEIKTTFLMYMLSQTNLTPQEVVSNCVDLMMGGVETTSNALNWTLYLLAKSPRVQDELFRHTQEVLPNNADVTVEKLQSMQYVKACIKETFRLYPLAYTTSRFIAKDIECCGYHIPAGTHCQANLYGMGRDEKLFEDPLSYVPERWLRENKDREARDARFQFLSNLAFGHGARMCIGRRIAEQELYILTSKIIQSYEVRCTAEVEPTLNVILVPERPIKLYFVPRS